MEKFLQFETAGGRLAHWSFSKYLEAAPEYDEPGWDTVHLIRTYKIESLKCVQDKCIANVRFSYVPTTKLAFEQIEAHKNGGSETLQYKISSTHGNWLLESTNGIPRVSYRKFLARKEAQARR